jgi:hypothetical protein
MFIEPVISAQKKVKKVKIKKIKKKFDEKKFFNTHFDFVC